MAELYLEVDHPKKTRGLAMAAQKRQYLRDHRREFDSVAQGIEIMNLAASSYYHKPTTDIDGQAHRDAELRSGYREREFAGYGYRRLGKQLRREGTYVDDKRIRRVQ